MTGLTSGSTYDMLAELFIDNIVESSDNESNIQVGMSPPGPPTSPPEQLA